MGYNVNFHYRKFHLGDKLTDEQVAFFNKYGFLHFMGVLSKEEVKAIINSYNEASEKLIAEKATTINGVPLFLGKDTDGSKMIHRFPFFSLYSKPMHEFIASGKLKPLLNLLEGFKPRIVENEKDGVVFNHYVNSAGSKFKQMGWHTDSIRDLFYDGKVLPMLNIGVYLDDSSETNGGLRVLPGTHTQKIFQLLFKKAYFLNAKEDKNEALVVATAGDVVVHHGHLWHRVGQSPFTGEKSRRRVMYIPAICGKFIPKTTESKTKLYHKLRPVTKDWF
ncbi:MAG TPA: phytanoyl-CoA dioxygenase family protein [Bacteroidia bacterium]|jgi:phytanoyl-CoA hydroxylase|nr:phytanoyl-CoA dioxygenase family protein [Bacteroidia bacterium]